MYRTKDAGQLQAGRWIVLSLTALALTFAAACGGPPAEEPVAETEPEMAWPPQLPGYAAMVVPADNPMTEDKVELGRMLYYDERLSGDGARACYGCHLEEHGLATDDKLAIGAFTPRGGISSTITVEHSQNG